MNEIAGIALAGGQGLRARPLTLEAPGHLRSKATVCFAGRPVIEWQIMALRDQGVSDFYLIANGRENRYQAKDVLGHGEGLGVRVRYSRPRMDWTNTGSGEATLSSLDYWQLDGLALVFPTDSLFEFDLDELVRRHRDSDAVVTVAVVERPAEEVAGKYGTMVTDASGQIRRFVEKPPLAEVHALAADPARVPVNAGLYLVDCGRLRKLAGEPSLAELARHRLDWGHDLLPWLVEAGHRVGIAPIAKLGDLGNLRDYLGTLTDALSGGYPHVLKGMLRAYPGNVRIHESSLRQRDATSGMTLAEKISAGLVRIGPNVHIGRDVEIGPGVVVSDSAIGDGVDLHTGCRLQRVACLDGAIIGPWARLTDTHVGTMAKVESFVDCVTVLSGYSALGNGVTVQAGVRLSGVTVYPGLTVPAHCEAAAGTSFETIADLQDA
ncbi:sugar phosphate nucleotidyltransferase [Nonomuraea sp. NPDC001831]|uniref:sugar phosphate nucleotidyltransferase n=1 Tax=Nonomuraea sp. NPDC001831 TaxID=3364340 RepID=UPI003685AC50